jgi:mono/diheme cytochrome c family protein
MTIRHIFPLCLLLVAFGAAAQENAGPGRDDKSQLPPSYVPSGKAMFKQYCASCHGADAKGRGPATPTLNTRVPDLTTLTKRHDNKFPYEYVESTLRFGPGTVAHGSPEMPVWGPIFQYVENYNEAAVRQRIKNLCDYIESLQQK